MLSDYRGVEGREVRVSVDVWMADGWGWVWVFRQSGREIVVRNSFVDR